MRLAPKASRLLTREHGSVPAMATTKPRKSGKSIPNDQRKRPKATFTLDPLAIDTVQQGAVAEGISPSLWVERAIFAYGGRTDEKKLPLALALVDQRTHIVLHEDLDALERRYPRCCRC